MAGKSQDKAGWPFLPDLLYRMAEAFGLQVALRFAGRFGGQRVRVPVTARPNSPVVQEFGAPMHAFLRGYIGGRETGADAFVIVPIGPRGKVAENIKRTDDAVAMMTERGMTAAEISQVLGLHSRTVHRARARNIERARREAARRKQAGVSA